MIGGATWILIATAALGGLFNVERLPWSEDETGLIVADFDGDGRGELALVSREQLTIYERNRPEILGSARLPSGTAAIDVADLDGDGSMELVAVAGEQVWRVPIARNGAEPDGAVLLVQRDNQYTHYTGVPFAAVLVVSREDAMVLALPCDDALELRSLQGEIVERYPTGLDAPRRLSVGQPFNVWSNQHPQAGAPGSLEFRITSRASYKPLMPQDALPIALKTPDARRGTTRQQREMSSRSPDHWPWFTIDYRSGTGRFRALYAQTDAPGGQTMVRVRQLPETAETSMEDLIGPPRHYPGLLLHLPDRSPDFNGDGFTDLLLWKADRVVPTADALSRTVVRGSWPLRVSARVYDPERRRFRAHSLGDIMLDVPVRWYLDMGPTSPLKTIFLHDANGDGRTDFGCLTEPDTVAFWLSEESGFSVEPDFRYTFNESIDAVELEMDLEQEGRTTIALRGGNNLYVLRPGTLFSD